jgi:hypothetical protein
MDKRVADLVKDIEFHVFMLTFQIHPSVEE